MCRRVQCSDCEKPTYAGCGAHVDQVLSDVPRDERCVCRAPAKRAAAEPWSPLAWFFQREP